MRSVTGISRRPPAGQWPRAAVTKEKEHQHEQTARQRHSCPGGGRRHHNAGRSDGESQGFGAMRLTGNGIWGEPRDRAEAVRVLRRAVELGVDFIDTADSYGPNVSKRSSPRRHPYPDGLGHRHQGGPPSPGAGQMGDQRPARASATATRGQSPPPATRPDRSLPAPSHRLEGARRRAVRRPPGVPARRPRASARTLRSRRRGHRRRPSRRPDRVRPEPLQRGRPEVGSGGGLQRAGGPGLHPLVSALGGGDRGGATARAGGSTPRRDRCTRRRWPGCWRAPPRCW